MVSDYPATTLAKNKGKFYVVCTIPMELREHFNGRRQLKRSTGTSDLSAAKRKQHDLSSELYTQLDKAKPDPLQIVADILEVPVEEVQDQEEGHELENRLLGEIHMPSSGDLDEDLAINLVRERAAKALEALLEVRASGRTLKAVSDEYLASDPYPTNNKTTRDAGLAIEQFLKSVGSGTGIAEIKTVTLHEYSEELGKTLGQKTIEKKMGYVSRMFDFATRKGWIDPNPFASFKVSKKLGKQKVSYKPLSSSELKELFELDMPEHINLLLSILTSSGMRLDEAALLDWEDVKDDENGNRYFDLTDKVGLVKNIGSARKVPVHSKLHGRLPTGKTGQMFPEFKRDKDGKAQAPASKASMKQIRKVTLDPAKVVHSLRGSFKDQLRDAGVSKEINDFITGHDQGDVAGGYGSGPSLSARCDAVEKLKLGHLP